MLSSHPRAHWSSISSHLVVRLSSSALYGVPSLDRPRDRQWAYSVSGPVPVNQTQSPRVVRILDLMYIVAVPLAPVPDSLEQCRACRNVTLRHTGQNTISSTA